MVTPVASAQARFLTAPSDQIRGFLFYGSDVSQIAARAESMTRLLAKRETPPSHILRLHDTDLTADSGRIETELATRSLFGGKTVLALSSFPVTTHDVLIEALGRTPLDGYLVIQSPNLKKSHKVTQLFESSPYLAAIACYGGDDASLPANVRKHLLALGHEIDDDAVALLVSRCGPSASLALPEAGKLAAYAGPAARITLAIVEACLDDRQTSDIFEVIDAALEGNGRRAAESFERLMASDSNVTPLLLALSAALQRLLLLGSAMQEGKGQQEAIRDLRPPVFYKQQESLARQIRLWTTTGISALLSRINPVLKETRLKPQLAESLTFSLILDIAKAARPR